jgi:hypothetical protein
MRNKNMIIIENIEIHVDMKNDGMNHIVQLNQHHDININEVQQVQIIIDQ